jgi:hypothetical protein
MATASQGISKITKAEKGIMFLHSGGMALLPTSSPAYNAMFDLIDVAELSLAEKIERARLAKALKEPPPEVRKPFADDFRRIFRSAAPATVKVKYAPPPIPGQALHPDDVPRRPTPPTPGQYRDSALARRLGLVQDEPTAGNPMLFLHGWEIVKGKDGAFARGTIAGHPHFPDGSVVDTPYLQAFDKDHNIFRAQDGTIISLGAVRPGLEARQSVLLEQTKQALAEPEQAKMLDRDEIPSLASISVDGAKVAMRFANNMTMKFPLNDPVGLVFTRAARFIARDHKIEWGGKLTAAPSPASAPAKHAPDAPSVPPVTLSSEPDLEALNREMAGEVSSVEPEPAEIHHPLVKDVPDEEGKVVRGKIIAATPPQDGGPDMYVYDVECGGQKHRVTVGKEYDRDLITLDACRQVGHVLIRGTEITAIEHTDGRHLTMEEAVETARPLHALKKRAVVEHSGDAPSFVRFQPSNPEAGGGGPSLG